MPVTTFSAAVHITPVVIQTFLAHSRRKAINYRNGTDGSDAKDDILYDQAFHIVKSFIELGINNTIESLQEFTNTRIPVPYWNAVSPVRIPLISCNKAADHLISWFEPEELKSIVGGERWWQVRGSDGVDAEWITEKEFLDPTDFDEGRQLSEEEHYIPKMEHLESVMLYIHGGGYSWGSIHTHRYQISRLARKFRGRAFAVNYRKAPQYPWPCPLHDVLAAYLYLIDPPPSALHKPVSPSKIVVAGDSAGGSLSLTLLIILRDLGLPTPAGGVLISPWVDLTHSFPSVLENTQGDIIPPHGFMAKPSTTWPLDPIPPEGGRISTILKEGNLPPEPNRAATPMFEHQDSGSFSGGGLGLTHGVSVHTSLSDSTLPSSSKKPIAPLGNRARTPYQILMKDPESTPLQLHSQVQMYASTEQISHPLISPINQGSLGNLPPLYIIAGNEEMLRDEVMYLAYRAASPERYPISTNMLDTKRQRESVFKFTKPTKVHLQVFDGMPHVLTVFTFTTAAKYAYRSIADFVKHVTTQSPEHIERLPFPNKPHKQLSLSSLRPKGNRSSKKKRRSVQIGDLEDNPSVSQEVENQTFTQVEVPEPPSDICDSAQIPPTDVQDATCIEIIAQRIDIHGGIRPMEPESEIPALQLRPEEIGIIKEGPIRRWLEGQEEWDRKFKRQAHNVLKRRKHFEARSARLLQVARTQGLLLRREELNGDTPPLQNVKTTGGAVQEHRRWGPLDLDDEKPPPSAICSRRDTPEAYALLKKHLYWAAPSTHLTVPKQNARETIRAAFDPRDDPLRGPRQSVSEAQNSTLTKPVHGLRIWDGIIGILSRKSAARAAREDEQAGEITLKHNRDHVEGPSFHLRASRESNSRHR